MYIFRCKHKNTGNPYLFIRTFSSSFQPFNNHIIAFQLFLIIDNRENFALDFGKSFLHYGWEKNVDRLYEQVDEITAAQIQAVAQELFDKDRLTTLIFK